MDHVSAGKIWTPSGPDQDPIHPIPPMTTRHTRGDETSLFDALWAALFLSPVVALVQPRATARRSTARNLPQLSPSLGILQSLHQNRKNFSRAIYDSLRLERAPVINLLPSFCYREKKGGDEQGQREFHFKSPGSLLWVCPTSQSSDMCMSYGCYTYASPATCLSTGLCFTSRMFSSLTSSVYLYTVIWPP